MSEIWKDIKGYEGIYQVSSLRRIKVLGRKIKVGNNGYRYIQEHIKYPNDKGIVSLRKHPYNIDSLMLIYFTEDYIQEFKTRTNEEGEIWKPVIGYESLYEISNIGRVRSLPSYTGDLLKKVRRSGKYMEITVPQIRLGRILKSSKVGNKRFNGSYMEGVILTKDGISKNFLVHRLVAEHFIPNPNNLPEVVHMDGNITNNRVDNLEWTASEYNRKHTYISRGAMRLLAQLANENRNTPEDMLKILIDMYRKKK